MPPNTAIDRARRHHAERWGAPDLITRAPGRVNLIGEHTDYNDGFTFPMALPFDVAVALSSNGDREAGTVDLWSEGFGDLTIDPTGDPSDTPAWARQITGVLHLLGRDHGIASGGCRLSVCTDIPTGASVSSSAAVEMAVLTALLARADITWPAVEMARLGQRVEHEIVGIPSGIMDQFIIAGALDGHASLMDCRALSLTPVRLPDDMAVVLMDSNTRRVLADAAYAARRAACERAAADIGVTALRDATLDDLDLVRDPTDRRRAHHVITENQRVVDAVAALQAGDSVAFGRAMTASHESLRDTFEVSGPGLDRIVEIAHGIDGCRGARMTGGGFAGCAVALVERPRADRFRKLVLDRYELDGNRARLWTCAPSPGSCLVG